MRLVEPTKVCSRCERRKPYGDFHRCFKDSEERGNRCKPCDAEYRREYVAQHPNKKTAYRQTHYRRVKADPEKYAIRLAERRESKRAKRGTPRERYRTRHDQRQLGNVVDSAPFVAWFESVQVRDGTTRKEAAERLGVAEKGIRMMQSGDQAMVELATVERALIADDTMTLRDLYPSLYQEAA